MSGNAIRDLQARSGLSPRQLGQLLGVSPNAIRLWEVGGQINAGHAKLAEELRGIVDDLPGDSPTQIRTGLFAPQQGRPSIFDDFVRRHHTAEGHETEPTP